MAVTSISLLDQILVLLVLVPPFLALVLFELITGQVQREWGYYRFYERERDEPVRRS